MKFFFHFIIHLFLSTLCICCKFRKDEGQEVVLEVEVVGELEAVVVVITEVADLVTIMMMLTIKTGLRRL